MGVRFGKVSQPEAVTTLMISEYHKQHVKVSHNNCNECRADCERQFLRRQWHGYRYVAEYLTWCKPRIEAIKNGENSTNAHIWHRDFLRALHRRITLKGGSETGRKWNDSYLQRLNQFPRNTDNYYLRRFARRGASTLH